MKTVSPLIYLVKLIVLGIVLPNDEAAERRRLMEEQEAQFQAERDAQQRRAKEDLERKIRVSIIKYIYNRYICKIKANVVCNRRKKLEKPNKTEKSLKSINSESSRTRRGSLEKSSSGKKKKNKQGKLEKKKKEEQEKKQEE